MIHREFREPNFRCVAEEPDERRQRWLTYGESVEEVTRRLTQRGWKVFSVKPYDFDEWRTTAARLTAQLDPDRRPGDAIEFSDRHWGQLKLHLFELFHEKCSYCEAKVLHVAAGDVEHFRPKRRVDDEPGHPGYFWLAYDPENLLPACEGCNRRGAKLNRFPVRAGTRAMNAASVPNEEPLLLNPYVEHRPGQHLEFLDTGQVRGRTPEGDASVETYRLGRRLLREERLDHFAALDNEVNARLLSQPFETICSDLIAQLRGGEREYSTALLQYMEVIVTRKEHAWQRDAAQRVAAIEAEAQERTDAIDALRKELAPP